MGRLLHHQWSAPERAIFIAALTITMGALFVTTYSLALGDPVPHRIKAALVGDARQSPRAADAVARMKKDGLDFAPYQSVASARAAIDEQRVYAALDVKTSARPTLYVASAAGGSVARILERDAAVDPPMLVVDTHPLAPADPNGVDIFYLMLVSSIIGFLTVFQVRANAGGLGLRHWTLWIVGLAVTASLVVTFVDSAILDRFQLPFAETWGILALHILAVASFASTAAVLLGRWAILPTWLFFVVLGNSSSGGAVSPPLLPQPFAFVSQWLPSGATVTSLRDAIYFYNFQHLRPLLVLGTWATVLFAAMIVASRKRQTSPGHG
ncbi:MAG TPA: hypothetical protein VI318_21315 [Baekduia sp.]